MAINNSHQIFGTLLALATNVDGIKFKFKPDLSEEPPAVRLNDDAYAVRS
jgi:hypothetical protein